MCNWKEHLRTANFLLGLWRIQSSGCRRYVGSPRWSASSLRAARAVPSEPYPVTRHRTSVNTLNKHNNLNIGREKINMFINVQYLVRLEQILWVDLSIENGNQFCNVEHHKSLYVDFYDETTPTGPGPHHRAFTITLRHTVFGKTSLDEWSIRHRDLYLTTHNTHKRQISMFPAGFEPAVPGCEWPLTHALDREATGICSL